MPFLRFARQKLGRLGTIFFVLLALYIVLYFVASGRLITSVFLFALYAAAVALAFKLFRVSAKKVLWRLRNRLIVAYVFIAVVPIGLIVMLVAIGAYILTGQIAVYLVNAELERRTAALSGSARWLAQIQAKDRTAALQRTVSVLQDRFPDLEGVLGGPTVEHYPPSSELAPPAAGWKDTSGIVIKDRHWRYWAHVKQNESDITLVSPLTQDVLDSLVPHLGVVTINLTEDKPTARSVTLQTPRSGRKATAREDRPPASNRFDINVFWASPVSVAFWDSPGKRQDALLVVHTRPSAVLDTVFGQKVDIAQRVMAVFFVVAALFLVVEVVSLLIGISLTRSITRAVHDLYVATKKVQEGDLSHRIEVRGHDQLAELGHSFNGMTENLGRLIVVEKEQQRMQSELTIAREVQDQLFPKAELALRTFRLMGLCNPARMVSGDYYDFLQLHSSVALAIGDVAGKGISAALLMASIQSIMRTQLTAGIPAAAAAGNGGPHPVLSTRYLVSQLNKQLYDSTSAEKYATFFFGLYDEASRMLTYTNAGHLPPILLREGSPIPLEVTGTVVGAFPFSRYEEKCIPLQTGDLLTAYTDGITEPENEYGQMFGEERLIEVLVKYGNRDGSEIISRVMESVHQWTGSSELQDDMTLLLARRV